MARRAAPLLLWLAALFLLLLVGAWAMLPVVVSSDVVRTAIENELTEITGQPVSVEGRVDLDLFPSPVARLYNVRVAGLVSPSEPDAPDFLTVDELEAAIPLSSLISREPAFTRFRLVRPYMRIGTGPHGEIDWSVIGGRLGDAVTTVQEREASHSAEGDEQPAAMPAAPQGESFGRFGTVTVENGTVEFVNTGAEGSEKITAVAGMVSWPQLSQRLTASFNGIWRGASFEQRSEIDNALRFFAGQISTARLNFDSAALTYSFDGKLSLRDTIFAEGAVKVATPSMRDAVDWLQIGIRSGRAVGAMSLAGTIHCDSRKIRFDNVSLTLQGNAGTGIIEFAIRENAPPAMTATLDFVDLDILSYLSAFTGLPLDGAGLGQPVSLSLVDEMDVDLRLSAASAKAGPVSMTEVAAVTQIRNGEAIFEIADAMAYGGHLQTRFRIGKGDAGVKGEFGANFDNVNTASLAENSGLAGLFPRGPTTGNVSVQAPVTVWSDLLSRASGTVELTSAGGVIRGVGFERLSGADGQARFFRLQESGASGATYDQLSLKALVQDGVVIIDKGTISYPAGRLELSGVIPYGTASIALTTIAYPRTVEGEPSASGVQHFIGGSWTNPYATPVLVPGAGQ